MNLIQSNVKTMSSREIAELSGKQHSKVMSVIIDLSEKGIAKSATPAKSKNTQNGQYYDEFNLDKRDSLVLVARLSPEFTAVVVDRWQELESAAQEPAVVLPDFSDPVAAARAWADAKESEQVALLQIEQNKPKVAFVENLVERDNLMTATQVGQKHKMSAVKINKFLDELGGVYNKSVKRGRAFTQAFIDKGYGELKQTEMGYSQALFTAKGEVWINEQLISEGVV